MSLAEIIEPNGQADTSLKFTAGLVMSVHFDAELRHLADPSRLRLKVKYPDQKTQVILPRPSHLKPLFEDSIGKGLQHFFLYLKVYSLTVLFYAFLL